jgi:nucleotide-binding universal stress UspA family protein
MTRSPAYGSEQAPELDPSPLSPTPVLLVGYDGSEPSVRALEWAVQHGRHGGRVIVDPGVVVLGPQTRRSTPAASSD